MALGQLEAGLKTIEERLDDTRRALESQPPREDPIAADIARALVSGLKNTTEATERKTRDAIDAVQGTLEAVVKRMAFLERDPAPAEDRRPAEQPSMPLRKPAEPKIGAAPEPEPPTQAADATEASDQPPPGLLSRLTSRQLLRRATGGRANRLARAGRERRRKRFPTQAGHRFAAQLLADRCAKLQHRVHVGRSQGAANAILLERCRGSCCLCVRGAKGGRRRFPRRGAACGPRRRQGSGRDGDDETPVVEPAASASFLKSRRSAFIVAAIAAVVVIAALVVLRTGRLDTRVGEIAGTAPQSAPVAEPEILDLDGADRAGSSRS